MIISKAAFEYVFIFIIKTNIVKVEFIDIKITKVEFAY